MSESLNNSNETSSSNNIAEEPNLPPFNKEAAETAREQRIAEYKAEHPKAVDDIDKARVMALAGDKWRTSAIDSEKKARRFFEYAKDSAERGNTDKTKLLAEATKLLNSDARDNHIIADIYEESAGREYDWEHNPNNPNNPKVNQE